MITLKGTKLVTTSILSFWICWAASVPQTMRGGWLFGIIMYSLKKGAFAAALAGLVIIELPEAASRPAAPTCLRNVRRVWLPWEGPGFTDCVCFRIECPPP